MSKKGSKRDVRLTDEEIAAVQSVQQILCYVPRCVYQYYLKKKTAPKPQCKSTEAAIMFADVSGFTALNERLAQRGASGFEDVSRHLNNYFSKLLDASFQHGGDVLKFAGDAVIVLFSTDSDSLAKATRRATMCALDIQKNSCVYHLEDLTLSCHIGISAVSGAQSDSAQGPLSSIHVGGVDGRWEFLVAGESLKQLESAVDAGKSGEVVLSKEAYSLVKSHVRGMKLDCGDYLALEPKGAPLDQAPLAPLPVEAATEPFLRGYLNKGVLARLDAGQNQWLGELRRVTVIFVNLKNLSFSGKKGDHVPIQNALCVMQKAIFRQQGMIRQLLVDDKGTVLIGVFGVPPFSHEDDAFRGTRVALEMQQELYKLGFLSAIGVTTGNVYCGTVGNDLRKEYAVVGDIVNLSARLMKAAGESGVLCDQATYDLVGDALIFQELPAIKVKGKTQLINIYRPHMHKKKRTTTENVILGRDIEQAMLEAKVLRAKETDGVSAAESVSATRKWKSRAMSARPSDSVLPSSTASGSPNASAARLRGTSSASSIDRSDGEDHDGLLVIEGERGSGKSLLVDHLAMLCEANQVAFHCVVSTPEHVNEFCAPWRSMILRILQCEGHGKEGRKQQIIGAIAASPHAKQYRKMIPLLQPLFPSLSLGDKRKLRMTEDEQLSNFRRLVVELIRSTSNLGAVILCFEHTQYFDKDSWLLLRYVCRMLPNLHVVVASVPLSPGHALDHLLPANNDTLSGRMILAPLPEKIISQLVCSAMKVKLLDAGTKKIIMEKSRGNAMFAIKIAKEMQKVGAVAVSGTLLKLTDQKLGEKCVCQDLISVIQSSVDRLHPTQQMILKIMGVVEHAGGVTDEELLNNVFPIENEKSQIPTYLRYLKDTDLVVAGSNSQWTLASSLIREGLYHLVRSQLLVAQRRQFHQLLLEYYEQKGSTKASILEVHRSGAASTNQSTPTRAAASTEAVLKAREEHERKALEHAQRVLEEAKAKEEKQAAAEEEFLKQVAEKTRSGSVAAQSLAEEYQRVSGRVIRGEAKGENGTGKSPKKKK